MKKIDTNSLTREMAKQTVRNDVVLNAAYIEGDWVTIEASDSLDEYALYDPNSGEVIATTRLCSAEHVESAVNAAATAYASWSQTSTNERAHYLNAIADAMTQQFDTLVGLSVLNNGKPIEEAKIDVSDAIACYRYYVQLITKQETWAEVEANEAGVRLLKTYAPVGVCALEFSYGHHRLEACTCTGGRLHGGTKTVRGDIITRADAGQYIVCY